MTAGSAGWCRMWEVAIRSVPFSLRSRLPRIAHSVGSGCVRACPEGIRVDPDTTASRSTATVAASHRVGSKPRDYHGFDMYRSAFSVKSAESGVVLDSLVADMMLVRFSIWDCA